jgi:hypothetical protein
MDRKSFSSAAKAADYLGRIIGTAKARPPVNG